MSTRRIKDLSIIGKNITPSTETYWTRPTDWLTLPTVGSSDQKTVGLVAIYDNDSNYIAFTATGNFTVDWGDGSSPVNYNTGVTAQYRYDYSTISAGTLTSDGFKQVIITITPQAGQTLLTLDFQKFHSDCVTGSNQLWLDLTIGVTSSFQLANYATNVANFPMLKQLSINNHGANLGSTMLRASAQNVAKVFINKVLNISSSGPFQYAYNLEEVYMAPGCTAGDCSNLFLGCNKLRRAPYFNTSGASNMSQMFANCNSLVEVPLYNTSTATNMTDMFNSCFKLRTVPLFNTQNVTTMATMFASCTNLETVPLFNTIKVTSMTGMFTACSTLDTVPLFNTIKVTSMASMFNACYNLRTVPTFYLPVLVDAGSMFSSCFNLKSIPDMFISTLANITSMLTSCTSLTKSPPMLLISATNAALTIPSGMIELDRMNANSMTAGLPGFTNCKLRRSQLYNVKIDLSYNGNLLGKTAINEVIENLGVPATSKALTITGNPGATLWPIRSRSSTTTSGSTTVSIADTSSFVTGMQVTGTGISDARSVTFQDSGDTVTLAGHGIANGKRVSFATITSTTGIVVYTPYYVINATTDTFQISLTQGGSAIALTTDGSGTMLYQTLVTAIDTNVSVTIDIPASASGTNTLAYRNLNTQIAIMKRWGVAG